MAKTNRSVIARAKRIKRIRTVISGSSDRPRLRVFKSNKHIYAQIIDDAQGKTLVAASTVEKGYSKDTSINKVDEAKKIGTLIAQKALSCGIKKVVFDRGGYIYHGRVKSLSDGAREGGLDF